MANALTDTEKLAVAARYAAASRTNDPELMRSLCAEGATTWHNFDGIEVPTEQTIKTIAWLHRTVADLTWSDVALFPTPSGFVSQSVMIGTAPGGALAAHTCVIVTLGDDGRIVRAEEYLDTNQTKALRG
jgi:hypothetical protein